MTQLTLNIKNEKDLAVILPLLERLNVTVEQRKSKNNKLKQKDNLTKIFQQNIDLSNFGDASTWQKKIRKERDIIILK